MLENVFGNKPVAVLIRLCCRNGPAVVWITEGVWITEELLASSSAQKLLEASKCHLHILRAISEPD